MMKILFSFTAIIFFSACGMGQTHSQLAGKDSCTVKPDTVIPRLEWHDTEFEPSAEQKAGCDTCGPREQLYQDKRYDYFIQLVYEPALQNPQLPAGNKAFLEQLKKYLACTTDSCGQEVKLIQAVYRHDSDNTLRIFRDQPDVYDSLANVFYSRTEQQQKKLWYRVYFADKKNISRCYIQKYKEMRTECSRSNSYILQYIAKTDSSKPAFCSPFDLQLEYVTDTVLNKLLYQRMVCEGYCRWLCGPGAQQLAFAKLKGVPGMYFTIDLDPRDNVYPSRGLYLNVENRFALELWKFELDLSGCACI